MAASYHQLGSLAQDRGDYAEAARQYQRSLDINERLGDQAGMASTYGQLGNLAQGREDYDEAARQYQRALDIEELLGDQAGMATAYHNLGILAQLRGDDNEAAGQYQRSLDIEEQLGNQAGIAGSYHQFGNLAQVRGDYDEAARQYQCSLDINERIGDHVGIALTGSQLGVLEAEHPDGSAAAAVGWHVKALVIRLRLGAPQAVIDVRRLAALRGELGPERFTSLLSEASGDTELTEAITSLLKTDRRGQDPRSLNAFSWRAHPILTGEPCPGQKPLVRRSTTVQRHR